MSKEEKFSSMRTLSIIGVGITAIVAFGASYMEIKINRANEQQDRFERRLLVVEKSALLNKENVNDNQRQIFRLETMNNNYQNKVIRLDEKVDLLSNSYVSHHQFTNKMDKLEAMTTNDLNRLGNVMYNDRKQLLHKVDTNTQYINFLRGILRLNGTLPNKSKEPPEKIDLSS